MPVGCRGDKKICTRAQGIVGGCGKRKDVRSAGGRDPDGKTVKDESGNAKAAPAEAKPGEVTNVYKDRFTVATGSGLLDIYELQSEGKKRMSAKDFLLSGRIKEGTVLG